MNPLSLFVVVRLQGTEQWRGPWWQFEADNSEMGADCLAGIRTIVGRGAVYYGGGGAAGEFSVEATRNDPQALPEGNPERYAYLIGLLDRHTLKLTSAINRWRQYANEVPMRRAYLLGFSREFSRTVLPLP